MKIVAVSDLHGFLPDIPSCDLLLLAGDLCPIDDHSEQSQARWLDTDFRQWLHAQPARQIVGIAGNHDLVFERLPEIVPRDLPWTYLQDSGMVWQGLRIWGTPWQPWFFDWAFNGTAEVLQRQWALIPADTEILVVHGPPYGFGDGVPLGNHVRLTGCRHLLNRITEIRPRIVVFGHIHEGRGQWHIGETILANVTLVDEAYQPIYSPWVCEL